MKQLDRLHEHHMCQERERCWRRANPVFDVSFFLLRYLFPLSFEACTKRFLKNNCMSHLSVVSIEDAKNYHSVVCITQSLALFPSPTKLLVSEFSHIFGHMDVSFVMIMDVSPNSLKDACMVESVASPRGDGKRK